MTPDELAAAVDELAREHEGEALVAAARRLALRLPPEQKDELARLLLERGASLEYAYAERRRARGWLRRTLRLP